MQLFKLPMAIDQVTTDHCLSKQKSFQALHLLQWWGINSCGSSHFF